MIWCQNQSIIHKFFFQRFIRNQMDKDRFKVYTKTEDIYVGTAKDVETRFDTSNDELEIPLPRGKIKLLD